MQFSDALTLDAPRRTQDGYLAVRARAARTGVYEYTGAQVDPDNKHGLRDLASVNVLRDDATVFDTAAVQSFIGKPVTDDHPANGVNSKNWNDLARGTIMGAMRDGDYLAFDIMLADAGAIAKVDGGKRELSNGYSAELEFGDFTAADGTKCPARQSKITGGNHVALVDRGRAGPECAIKDFAVCDAITADALADLQDVFNKELNMSKKIVIDGLQVDLSDADATAAAITKLQTAAADAQTALATATTETATKDAKIATLEKAVADAKVTPAQLLDAAKAYAGVCDKAKAMGVKFADGASEDEIMKAAVDAKMADAAKDWTADQIAASFAVLSLDTKVDTLRQPLADGLKPVADAAAEIAATRAAALAAKSIQYKGA